MSGENDDNLHAVELGVADTLDPAPKLVPINKDSALDDAHMRLQMLEARLARVEQANATLTDSLQDAQSAKKGLQDKVLEATTLMNAAEERSSTSEQYIGRLTADNERLSSGQFQQQASIVQLTQEVEAASKVLSQQQESHAQQQADYDVQIEILGADMAQKDVVISDQEKTLGLLAEQSVGLEDKISELETGSSEYDDDHMRLQRQYDEAIFKLNLNTLVDNTKERHLREELPVRIKAIFEEVAIPVFDVDFAAAAFGRDSEPIYSTSELLAEVCVRDFIIDNPEVFEGREQLQSWFLSEGYLAGLQQTIRQISLRAFPSHESWIGDVGQIVPAEANETAEKNIIIDLMAAYLLPSMESMGLEMTVEDRGSIGFLIMGRKRDMLLSVADTSGLEKGDTIATEFGRDRPLDTKNMRARWDTLAEQIDDMAAAYHDVVEISDYAASFEKMLDSDPLLGTAASKGHRDALTRFTLENAYVVYLDDPSDRNSFRVLKGGHSMNDSEGSSSESEKLLNRISPEIVMGGDLAGMMEELGVRDYLVTDVTSGKTVVGRTVAFNKGRPVNYFERRVIDTYSRNLGDRITDYNETLAVFRASVDKDTAQRLVAERITFTKPKDHQRDQNLNYQPPKKQNVAILYADIQGFTSASQEIDSQDLVKIREILFANTRDITDELKVMHDKLIGDCTLDLSGPPFFERTHYEDVATGVECLLRFNERVHELNRDVFQNPEHLEEILYNGDPKYSQNTVKYLKNNPVKLTTGMAYGAVIFGDIGTEESRDFSVLGEAANLGARMQGAAEADEVLICSTSFRILTGYKGVDLPKYSAEPFESLDGKYLLIPMGEPKKFKNVKKEQFIFRVDRNPDYHINHNA